MHHPLDRITHTTAFGTPVVERWLERKIAQGSIIKDRSDDPSHHERTLLPGSYISLCTDEAWPNSRYMDSGLKLTTCHKDAYTTRLHCEVYTDIGHCCVNRRWTGPDGANVIGTAFASRYRLQPRSCFLKAQWVDVRPLHPLLSH